MARNLSGRRVLIVEDSYVLATGIATFLQDLGCTIVGTVGTVQTALEFTNETKLDAAIVDYDLHGATSVPVLDELRRRSVPVLIVTAYDRAALMERVRSMPILQKPFLRVDLERCATALFERPVGPPSTVPP